MISILVFGHWDNASRVARALNSRADDMKAAFVPQRAYPELLARPPRTERVVLVRAGYRTGASSTRGRLFDTYWSLLRRSMPHAVPCHYWLGTDVLDTVEEARAGTLRWAVLSSARGDLHLAVAPWLASELHSVGLDAAFALLPPPVPAPSQVPPLPSEFSVLTYLPTLRFGFYGGDTILEAAQRLPGIRFDIVGAMDRPVPVRAGNLNWLGWVNDMPPRYAQATVVVRVPLHDGFGNTVIEGLLYGRHCVYTQEVPFVRQVRPADPDALVQVLTELHEAHTAGQLGLNLAGRTYALEAFDQLRLEEDLAALVRSRL